jgi:hypothetical protein
LFRALAGYPAVAATVLLAGEVLDRILRETTAAYAERLATAIPQIWANEVERLRADFRGWLTAADGEESGWTPIEVEREFDEVSIAEGWKLRGRINLVEQAGNGAIRVTNYKMGRYWRGPKPNPENRS